MTDKAAKAWFAITPKAGKALANSPGLARNLLYLPVKCIEFVFCARALYGNGCLCVIVFCGPVALRPSAAVAGHITCRYSPNDPKT